MYFKNDLGTVKIEGDKVITETRFSITTIEVKAIAYIRHYYFMQVAALKQMKEISLSQDGLFCFRANKKA